MNIRDFNWFLAGAVIGSLAGMLVMALMVIAEMFVMSLKVIKQSDEAGGVSDAHADEGNKAQGKAE